MRKQYTIYKITCLEKGTIKGLQTLFTGNLAQCYDHYDTCRYGESTNVILSKRKWEEIIDKPWFAMTFGGTCR